MAGNEPDEWRNAARTIVDVLRQRSERQPDGVAYTLLAEESRREESLTYADLDARARAIGKGLCAVGDPGDRVLLHIETALEFVVALFGCLCARMIAVPVYPLDSRRLGRTASRLLAVVRDASADVGLTDQSSLQAQERATASHPSLSESGIEWYTLADIVRREGNRREGSRREGPRVRPTDVAILQYTSGSVGTPKGVVVTHDNIMRNEAMIQRAHSYSREYTFVSWMPLAHDWGLIGGVLQPMYSGARSVLMPTRSFLRRPWSWLGAISKYSRVVSGGPGFAYDICSRKIPAEERGRLDLTGWVRAGVGASMVHAETLEKFSREFAPCGFRREAFYNGYGLAEATLSVSATPRTRPPTVLTVDRTALEEHRVRVVSSEEQPAARVVGSGVPNCGETVAIVDPATGRACTEDRIGEIWVAGPNVAAGYWRNAEATARTFGATCEGSDREFLRTGDLGFVHDGELFVVGRLKDLIIVRGRNLYPDDIEHTVAACHAALRPGGTVAFSVMGEDDERLVVVQELRSRECPGALAVADCIRRTVLEIHEITAYAVVLVAPGSVMKTSSGKLRRGECRAGYVRGSLEVVAESVLEADVQDAGSPGRIGPSTPTEARLFKIWAEALGTDDFGIHDNFVDLGGESMSAQFCLGGVSLVFGRELPLELLLSEQGTVAGMAAVIDRE